MTTAQGVISIGWVDWIGQFGVTFESDIVINSMPPENVRKYETGLPFRFSSLNATGGEATLRIRLQQDRSFDCLSFALAERDEDSLYADFESDLQPGDQVRWQMFADDDGLTPVWDSGFVDPLIDASYGTSCILTPTDPCRRIDFTVKLNRTPAATFDKVDIGRVGAWPLQRFGTHHKKRNRDGIAQNASGHAIRTFAIPFGSIREDERAALLRNWMGFRADRQALLIPRDSDLSNPAFVRRRQALDLTRQSIGRNQTTMQFREMWGTID